MRQRLLWLQATKLLEQRRRALHEKYVRDQIDTDEDEYIQRDPRCKHYENETARINDILEQLESFISILDAENEWKPYTIFGVEASTSLTMTVLTSYISFIGLVLMLFSNYTYIGSALMSA